MADFVGQKLGPYPVYGPVGPDNAVGLSLAFTFLQGFTQADFWAAQTIPPVITSDLVAPTSTLISPALGNIDPSTPVVVDVEDDRELKRVSIWVEYPNLGTDLIYGRGQFMPSYNTSTEQVLVPGPPIRKKRFTLVKQGGWPEPPYIWVEGIDPGGNVS